MPTHEEQIEALSKKVETLSKRCEELEKIIEIIEEEHEKKRVEYFVANPPSIFDLCFYNRH